MGHNEKKVPNPPPWVGWLVSRPLIIIALGLLLILGSLVGIFETMWHFEYREVLGQVLFFFLNLICILGVMACGVGTSILYSSRRR